MHKCGVSRSRPAFLIRQSHCTVLQYPHKLHGTDGHHELRTTFHLEIAQSFQCTNCCLHQPRGAIFMIPTLLRHIQLLRRSSSPLYYFLEYKRAPFSAVLLLSRTPAFFAVVTAVFNGFLQHICLLLVRRQFRRARS